MMEYKGYKAQIDFDEVEGMFHGEVINGRTGISFEGRSVDELQEAFHGAVEEYLDCCRSVGRDPDETYTGRFAIHIAPDLHKSIVLAARREGKPIHTWIAEQLSEAARAYRLV